MNAKASFCRQRIADRLSPAGYHPQGVRAVAVLLVTLCASLCAPLATAGDHQRSERDKHTDPRHQTHQTRHPQPKNSGLSPQQAVSIAKQRQQGKVLSVKRSNGAYKVKMLHQGQVRYITVAAE